MVATIGVLTQQIARVAAALPAAGAWTVPTELVVAEADTLTIHFNYVRGAVGGAFDWQLQVSAYSIAALVPAGAAEWTAQALYDSGAVAANTDTQSRVQREYITYGGVDANGDGFVYGPIDLAARVERIRIRARESGVVGTPGTLQIEAVIQ